MNCRFCDTQLYKIFLDLGFAPMSNSYLSEEDLSKPELYFPLKLYVCHNCFLVQTENFTCREEIFKPDYAYFSSVSTEWLKHAEDYSEMITDQLSLDSGSYVIEIASNDGYLLKNFVKVGIPCLGIEPTDSTADEAELNGIPVLRKFFGSKLAKQLSDEGKHADLIIGNNVYAHVPDIIDFTKAMKQILKSGGTITLEFPHLLKLIENSQFDTVYHEHFSYLSLLTVSTVFKSSGLKVINVEELDTHGGSLRIFGCHEDDMRPLNPNVKNIIEHEKKKGLNNINSYSNFQQKADRTKNNLVEFLINQKNAGKTVVAYGAAAKGNTILNYAGIKPDLIPFVCDAAPSKLGKYLPGSHIPIVDQSLIYEVKPNYILLLPWNLNRELMDLLSDVKQWDAMFVQAVPELLLT